MIKHIKGMIAWSARKPKGCDKGIIKGTFCRNWRTWLGHSTFADLVTAITMLPLLFTGNIWAVVVGYLGWLGINAFYTWREFGKNGNFYENTPKGVPDRNDKKTDSVLDLMAPVFTSTFLKFSMGPGGVLAVSVIQFAVTYILYRKETE